jgi:hypothetical protein
MAQRLDEERRRRRQLEKEMRHLSAELINGEIQMCASTIHCDLTGGALTGHATGSGG